MILALLFAVLGLFVAPAAAQSFPALTGRVVDQADLLPPDQEAALDSKLAGLESQSGRQLVVATVRSLEGRTIEDYGYHLGRTWAIGDVKRDDGVILLVAPNEKKVRIETGYGARVVVTDAVSSLIVRTAILPRFKAGDFAGGIVAGTDQLVSMLSLPDAEAQRRAGQIGAQEKARSQGSGGIFPIIFWMIIIFFVIMPMVRRAGGGRRYRRGRRGISPIILWGPGFGGGGSGWGGGGGGFGGFGGGGGFSGGGGGFGGGGASGGW